MKKPFSLLAAFSFCFVIQSCTDKISEEVYHYTDEEYELLSQRLDLPQETFDYTLVTNIPINIDDNDRPYHKATLGRVLFYDNMLSIDESKSCASCHKQEAAFADDAKFSEGLNEQVTTRNSLPLGNTIGFVKYYGTDLSRQTGFFSWDESFESINDQSRAAILSEKEMGHNFWELTKLLREEEHYQILFEKAYGSTSAITEENILDAITEFVNSLSSRESKFDKSVPTPANRFAPTDVISDFAAFSDTQNRGKRLFNDNCSSCHGSTHNSIVLSSANNGLDLNYQDKGLGAVDGAGSYLAGVFKVPSLRNIEISGPYMHDGRFETLEEVVEHYSSGIQDHQNLSQFLKSPGSGSPKNMNFSNQDKNDIIAYLKTLTDDEFVALDKYSDPFK